MLKQAAALHHHVQLGLLPVQAVEKLPLCSRRDFHSRAAYLLDTSDLQSLSALHLPMRTV